MQIVPFNLASSLLRDLGDIQGEFEYTPEQKLLSRMLALALADSGFFKFSTRGKIHGLGGFCYCKPSDRRSALDWLKDRSMAPFSLIWTLEYLDLSIQLVLSEIDRFLLSEPD